jgi:proteasome lid subunit RPN8/RPN11
LAAQSLAAARNLHLLGFFHSHPFSTAQPSSTDLAKAVAGLVYVISAPALELTGWYSPSAGVLEPVELVISP